jgi:hypothetical protein
LKDYAAEEQRKVQQGNKSTAENISTWCVGVWLDGYWLLACSDAPTENSAASLLAMLMSLGFNPNLRLPKDGTTSFIDVGGTHPHT